MNSLGAREANLDSPGQIRPGAKSSRMQARITIAAELLYNCRVTIRHFSRTVGLARRNFFANGRRNFFSVLTVILGSLAIGAVFTVNANVNTYIDDLIARGGGPNLFVRTRNSQLVLTETDLSALRALTSVRYLVPNAALPVNLIVHSESFEITAHRHAKNYSRARPVETLAGQFLSDWDENMSSKNIVLSPAAVEKLGLAEPIGTSLTLSVDGQTYPVEVIGVAKPLFEPNERGLAWLPTRLFEQAVGARGIASLILGFTSYSLLDDYEAQVLGILEPHYGKQIEIYNPKQSFEAIRKDYQVFIRAGAIVGVLALLAGSVGVQAFDLFGDKLSRNLSRFELTDGD